MYGEKKKALLEKILDNDPDFTGTIPYGNDRLTIMATALMRKYKGLVEMLIEAGDDINRKSSEGNTPLMYAVSSRNDDMIKLMLEKGAKLDTLNDQGLAAIHLTIFYKNAAICGMSWRKSASLVATLVENGDDINRLAENPSKDSLLTLAAKRILYSYPSFVKQLFDMGADFNYINGDGNSVLHFAALQW